METEPADASLSLVIPLYHEASHFAKSFRVIHDVVRDLDVTAEYVLVDDGSTDTTWQVVMDLQQKFPEIRAIRFSRNFGKEAAMSAGLRHATGDAVIVLDADLQHPPALIPEMLRRWREEGAEIVDGVKRSRGGEPFWRRLGARFFSEMLRRFSGFDMAGATDFKLLDRKVVDAWLTMDEYTTFYRGMTEWLGFRHQRLPFDVADRSDGASSWNAPQLLRLALNAVTSFSSSPLHIITICGSFFIVAAALLAMLTLIRWISGHALSGFSTVIILQLIIGSIIMLSMGITGEYLANIFYEAKKRPRYIIRELRNPENPPGE
jgi:polyisoprenyl-phosphate glycosyltransferase